MSDPIEPSDPTDVSHYRDRGTRRGRIVLRTIVVLIVVVIVAGFIWRAISGEHGREQLEADAVYSTDITPAAAGAARPAQSVTGPTGGAAPVR